MASSLAAFGQGLSKINGSVTDPSGASIARAKVIAKEIDTGLTRSGDTTTDGYYVLTSLRPTAYSLEVEVPGFRRYTQTGITVQADETATINVKLEIGSATESMTVEAAASQVDTTTSTIGQVADSTRIVELPLNGRNAAQLTTLVAGSVLGPSNAADQGVTKTFPAAVTASINGTRTNQTSFMLDGLPNNNIVGDFSALLSATNPNNPLGKAIILKDPISGQPLPGNLIPLSELDPASLKMTANWFPRTDGNGLIFYSEPIAQNFDEETGRFDYSISNQDRVAFRYFRDAFQQPAQLLPNNILTYSDYGSIVDTNAVLQETHIFGPALLNDARFGVVRETDQRGPPSNSPSLASFGVQNVFPPSVPAIESISTTGYWSTGTFPPGQFPRVAFVWSEVVRYERGHHGFAFGGQFERDRLDESTQTTRGGSFTFSGDTTGNALADFMSGRLRTFSQGNGTIESNRHNFFDLWAQDTFKVGSRLTLNYGLRWEPSLPWHDRYQTAELFLPNLYYAGVRSQVYVNAPPGEVFPGDPGGRAPRAVERYFAANWICLQCDRRW